MRLLIATSYRSMAGGVERYLQALLPGLIARGHQVALLYQYPFDPKREKIDRSELRIPALGIEESGPDAALRFVEDWAPDVVYSQGFDAPMVRAALLNTYPAILYAHNYVGTCASEEKCHAVPSPRPCDRHFGPACLLLYYPRRCGGLHPGTMWKMYRRAADRNVQLPKYTAVIVASAHMRREFERNGVAPENIHLAPLPNPEEGAGYHIADRTSSSRDRLLFLGRLTKLKGIRELLSAIPPAEKKLGRALALTIAGDGPERQRLEEIARRHQLNVRFAGWLAGEKKKELMRASDLLVVPSLWPEPFGLVGIEAGVHGVPSVAFDVGGISDWLIPGYSGEIAAGNPPAVEELTKAICRALSDPAHYADLCQGAREVASRFTLDAHMSKLESILESVLEAAPPSKDAALRAC